MDKSVLSGVPMNSFPNLLPSHMHASSFAGDKQDYTGVEADDQHFPFSPTSNTSSRQANNSGSPSQVSPEVQKSTSISPRSCVTCRKRKVRCDKKQPCSNCARASIECIFPRPGRAPRRSKKPPDSELLLRLRRLESVVQSLGMGADGEALAPEVEEIGEGNFPLLVTSEMKHSLKSVEPQDQAAAVSEPKAGGGTSTSGLERGMGRLVIEDGRSRYVSHRLWAGLTEELTVMNDFLDNTSDEEEDYPSPHSDPSSASTRMNHQTFIFGYSSAMVNLRVLHPAHKQMLTYWEIYKENVDPMVRLLHRGTTERLFLQAAAGLDHISKAMEALMFAMYLAATVSLTPDQCLARLAVDKDIALKRYRFGAEQALAKAGFLESQEIMVLQAFVLFLVSVRRHDDSKCVWMLIGLAVRMAISLGLHRDGAQFGLNAFEIEMRRRLWWQICMLDVRSSEDQGAEATIPQQISDTKLPININDEDIWPNMEGQPIEHEGCTEMTFDLVRYEIGKTVRFLIGEGRNPVAEDEKKTKPKTVAEKDEVLRNLQLSLDDRFLKYCDIAIPLQFVAINVSRLIMAKLWLVIHSPNRRKEDCEPEASQETKDRLFNTSVDVVRYSRILETARQTTGWGWLFRTHIQWQAVAFLLTELCTRTSGAAVEEAWRVLEDIFDAVFNERSVDFNLVKKSMLWKPIRRLMAKARLARSKELERKTTYPTDGSLGPIGAARTALNSAPPVPRSLSTMSPFDTTEFLPMAPELLPQVTVQMTPLVHEATSAYPPDSIDEWLIDEATMQLEGQNGDGINGEEIMDWAGWDEMVRDFQIEASAEEPAPFNMSSWW